MLKTKYKITSTAFIALISAYFTFMLNIKFWQFAFERITIDNFTVILFILGLPFFIYIPLFWFFSLIVVPKAGKPLVMLLLILSSAADYAMRTLGVVLNSDMIRNFAETNVREATDLITLHGIFYVLLLGVVPAVLIGRTEIRFMSFGRELRRRLICFVLGLVLAGSIASLSYKEYASFGRNNKQVRYYINTFNYIYAVGRYYKRAADAKKEFVILDNTPQHITAQNGKPRVVVLIVGETARAKNFGLYGYERNTTPELSASKEIITFKDVTSCGTATAVSLPCMFSHFPRNSFSLSDAEHEQNLLDIVKASGYDVLWIDNDDGCKRVCKRVATIDTKQENRQTWCFGNYCHDDILLENLRKKLTSIQKDTLIVLHMMGSHGPAYFKRYPENYRKFTPSCDTADLQTCTREQIIASYDNTIVYTDHIIATVIDELRQRDDLNGGMLYVSDHGESLGENNIYLHGLPYAIAPDGQKKVPMILWLSQNANKDMNLNETCLREKAATDKFTHDNYFHSVLKLLNIQTRAYEPALDIFASCQKK